MKRQEWRWCPWCLSVIQTTTKFCPFDNWYLTDQPPLHIPIRRYPA